MSTAATHFIAPRTLPRFLVIQNSRALYWLQGFLFFQILCQLGLLVPEIGALRVVVRVAAFGLSLIFLLLIRGQGVGHPARRWAAIVMGIMALGFFHPSANTFLSGLAQCGLYLAILAPLFWVSRMRITTAGLGRMLIIIWAFQTLSATFGVLQVLYPGQFQPNLSVNYSTLTTDTLDSLKVTLADGQKVFRPMGLTDIPGGAAGAGMYSVLIAIGMYLRTKNPLLRLTAVASMGIGLFCIYLSQTRSVLVVTGVCGVSIMAILMMRGEWNRLVSLIPVLACVVFFSFLWAVAVGGESVTKRLSTLSDDRADQVYYRNRGHFLESTINDLVPEYPFGAGLGRWGMTHAYFADDTNPNSYPIWVEIQWTGWLLDGGIPLVAAYTLMVILSCVVAARIALSRMPGDLPLYAAVILAYDIGVLALTFNYAVFIGSGGLDFWLLNAVLFAAASVTARQARPGNVVSAARRGSSSLVATAST